MAKKIAASSNSRIVIGRFRSPDLVCINHHGSQLKNPERLARFSRPHSPVKYRSSGIELHPDSQGNQKRPDQEQADQGRNNVKYALHRETPVTVRNVSRFCLPT